MASMTKNDGKNDMADEVERQTPSEDKPPGAKDSVSPKFSGAPAISSGNIGRGGFFTIYKKGQGYWTRIGTVVAAALIALLTTQFLYSRGRIWFTTKTISATGVEQNLSNMPLVLAMVGGFLLIFSLVIYRIINRPNVVDFLIATDSEMKKVNWTTRAELIGSTKIVIFFMLLIAAMLFVMDVEFQQVLYYFNVLVTPVLDLSPAIWWLLHCKLILTLAIPVVAWIALHETEAVFYIVFLVWLMALSVKFNAWSTWLDRRESVVFGMGYTLATFAAIAGIFKLAQKKSITA